MMLIELFENKTQKTILINSEGECS